MVEHAFGGEWTKAKLDVVSKYLHAYVTALKRTSFRLGYVDAFAGTGRIDREATGSLQEPLPLDEPDTHLSRFLDGSVRMALQVDPPFDSYLFIERSDSRFKALEELRDEYSLLGDRIRLVQGDCNDVLVDLCEKDWGQHRAVLFLDPYGMQVNWRTIEAVAATGAIDTWILFPHAIGVNRLLRRDGQIPESWRRRLDMIFGTKEWYREFYVEDNQTDLWEDEASTSARKVATLDSIAIFYIARLKGVFGRAVEHPYVLCNSQGTPLFTLCFACGSKSRKGQELAMRIARHILGS